MSHQARLSLLGSTFLVTTLVAGFGFRLNVRAAGPTEQPHGSYRVLAPIESGNLLLFPVAQSGKTPGSPFLTLDEGIKSGQVEVTEAGRVRGLVRPRPATGPTRPGSLPTEIPSRSTIAATRSTRWCWSTTRTSLCFCLRAKSSRGGSKTV